MRVGEKNPNHVTHMNLVKLVKMVKKIQFWGLEEIPNHPTQHGIMIKPKDMVTLVKMVKTAQSWGLEDIHPTTSQAYNWTMSFKAETSRHIIESSAQAIIFVPNPHAFPTQVCFENLVIRCISLLCRWFLYQDLWRVLVVCERVVVGRAAMQCYLLMELHGRLYFCSLQTAWKYFDFLHTSKSYIHSGPDCLHTSPILRDWDIFVKLKVWCSICWGVLVLTPGSCWPFHFPLITCKSIYFQHEARCSEHLVFCCFMCWYLG